MKKLASVRSRKSLVSLVLLLLVALIGLLIERSPELDQRAGLLSPGLYRVTSIHDGDTIAVDMDGHEETIRLIGVDTPETHDPRKAVQCFGQAATDFTKQLIGQQPVRLEADPLSSNRDRYDRLLRYVYLPDRRLVQAEIIREGYGFALTGFPHTKMEEFQALQREARQQDKGLWQECRPTQNDAGIFTSPDAN